MRMILAVASVLAMGCGDDGRPRPTDEELHEKVACSAAWKQLGAETCEMPCAGEVRPAMSMSNTPACEGAYVGPGDQARTWGCTDDALFEHDGVLGCCARFGIGDGKTVYFAVCDGE